MSNRIGHRILNDFVSLLFPELCYSCGEALFRYEKHICTHCILGLPKTNFHRSPDNPLIRLFWGRLDLAAAGALYHFAKGGKVQHIIHNLKYKGHKELGETLGKIYGEEVKDKEEFKSADLIVPVPLHKKKQMSRGYNQSEYFAAGLSASLDQPLYLTLRRNTDTKTQTKKSRFERWENVETVFSVQDPEMIYGKHVLLVDDVITTGSTLESCGNTLLSAGASRVTLAAIAYAKG